MIHKIICPISAERADSHISRLTVFINALLMIAFLITLNPILVYVVTIDYGVRASGFKKYSPVNRISALVISVLKANGKMIDIAPKTFASRLGFICAVLGSVFITFDMILASRIIIGFFAALAILDSVFDFCVGCLIYYEIVYPFYKNRGLVD